MNSAISESPEIDRHHWIYRHSVLVRVTHWINVICLTALFMSGLQIFNAHPALYWGKQSTFDAPFLEMKATSATPEGNGGLEFSPPTKGVVTIAGRPFDTTGWLGLASDPDGSLVARGFPSWITLPGVQDLATARRWHFFFAWLFVFNGALYVISGILSGHFRRDLWARLSEWRSIGPSILEHIRLRFPRGEEARHYNVLQKLSYLFVIFILLPVMILAGMAMSPGLDAVFPWLLSVFGGRQSARTVHFIAAFGIVLFALVHIAMVLLSGVFNNLRSMITGRYDIGRAPEDVHESK